MNLYDIVAIINLILSSCVFVKLKFLAIDTENETMQEYYMKVQERNQIGLYCGLFCMWPVFLIALFIKNRRVKGEI